jgi:hypothetical protein
MKHLLFILLTLFASCDDRDVPGKVSEPLNLSDAKISKANGTIYSFVLTTPRDTFLEDGFSWYHYPDMGKIENNDIFSALNNTCIRLEARSALGLKPDNAIDTLNLH